MHAYLFVGQENTDFQIPISELATKLRAKTLEYPLQKIDDTRSLNNLIRLSFDKPTLIVCKNIHEAGEETLNAFLKNLEEPQENIYFALTAPSTRKVLPTIVSRCQVIRTTNDKLRIPNKDAEQFTKLSVGARLAFVDKIKDRNKAVEFAESLINFLHENLHLQKADYSKTSKNLETASQTLTRLKANGNVPLQLTNLVISLV
jgi:DNA polymerase-3 subunit delta'